MTTVVAAGTFDILHPGHLHYLAHARKLGQRLVVIISSDDLARKSGKKLVHDGHERAEIVRSLKLVDEAIVGDFEDPLRPILKIKPDIIFLGYDQKLPESVDRYCVKNGVKVLRDRCCSDPQRHKTSKIKERIRKL